LLSDLGLVGKPKALRPPGSTCPGTRPFKIIELTALFRKNLLESERRENQYVLNPPLHPRTGQESSLALLPLFLYPHQDGDGGKQLTRDLGSVPQGRIQQWCNARLGGDTFPFLVLPGAGITILVRA